MWIFGMPKLKGDVYSHTLAPAAEINGGAEEFVFEPAFGLPVQVFRGAARLAGALLITERPEIALHPTGAPQGIPQQPLSDIYIQDVEALNNG